MSTQTQSHNSAGGMLMTLAVLTLIILIAVWYMNLPGNHTIGQRIGNAIDDTPHAVVNTTDKLAGPQTAAKVNQATVRIDSTLKKTGDAVSSGAAEVGNDIKAAVAEQKRQNADHRLDHVDGDTSNN